MYGYAVLLHHDEASDKWLVDVPDLPGIITEGETFEEALHMVREIIPLHLDVMRVSGKEIPAPSVYVLTAV